MLGELGTGFHIKLTKFHVKKSREGEGINSLLGGGEKLNLPPLTGKYHKPPLENGDKLKEGDRSI